MHEAVGRTQTLNDTMDPVRAEALYALLGLNQNAPTVGDALLPFSHQAYFWDIAQANELGFDGHAELGKFIPNLGLPNRMWAGGSLRFINPLLAGVPAKKTSTIETIEHKTGRAGIMAFVTVRHEIIQEDRLAVTEWQTLVYREPQHL